MKFKTTPLTKAQFYGNADLVDLIEGTIQYASLKSHYLLAIDNVLLNEKQPLKTDLGLCSTVFHGVPFSALAPLFRAWQYYSGSDQYPVPATANTTTAGYAQFAYCNARRNCAMLEGEYGELRTDLYEFTLAGLATLKELILLGSPTYKREEML
jgi:hypothetical protein